MYFYWYTSSAVLQKIWKFTLSNSDNPSFSGLYFCVSVCRDLWPQRCPKFENCQLKCREQYKYSCSSFRLYNLMYLIHQPALPKCTISSVLSVTQKQVICVKDYPTVMCYHPVSCVRNPETATSANADRLSTTCNAILSQVSFSQ